MEGVADAQLSCGLEVGDGEDALGIAVGDHDEVGQDAPDRCGVEDVAVLEAPTVYGNLFANRSVAAVARYFGFDSPEYRIVDTLSPWTETRGPSIARITSAR